MNYRIEVDLVECCGECGGFHYVIMNWQSKPDNDGFWYNIGIAGFAEIPELAFAEGLRRFQERN